MSVNNKISPKYSIHELEELFFFVNQDRDDIILKFKIGVKQYNYTHEDHYQMSINPYSNNKKTFNTLSELTNEINKPSIQFTEEQKNYILNDLIDKGFSILDDKIKFKNYLMSNSSCAIFFNDAI